MQDIHKIDKNFEIKTNINKENITFFDADDKPFKIYGVFREGNKYRRIPESVAKTVNEGVLALHANTAGGRVRFCTNSSYVAVHAIMEDGLTRTPHFALSGSAGMDLYVGKDYMGTYAPPITSETQFESVLELGSRQQREITINLPLYSNVNKLYIGLEDDATVGEASEYTHSKPIVYYGSSITQGGCASRAGMSYQGIVSRRFDCDFVNLGFSGNAKAEDTIADYIKNLDMSIFVYDYDHNAPTVEHLERTHERMFKIIREQNPTLPIIMMSRPVHRLNEDEIKRRSIIETTYKNALASGDTNVYFLDGAALTELCLDEGTVDKCHPTDFGFASMAKAVGDLIEKLLCK